MNGFRDEKQLNAACQALVVAAGLEGYWTPEGPSDSAKKERGRDGSGTVSAAVEIAWHLYESPFGLEESPFERIGLSADLIDAVDQLRVAALQGPTAVDDWLFKMSLQAEERRQQRPSGKPCSRCKAAPRIERAVDLIRRVCWKCARWTIWDRLADLQRGVLRDSFWWSVPEVISDELESAADTLAFLFTRWDQLVPREHAHVARMLKRVENAEERFRAWRDEKKKTEEEAIFQVRYSGAVHARAEASIRRPARQERAVAQLPRIVQQALGESPPLEGIWPTWLLPMIIGAILATVGFVLWVSR